MEDDVASEQCIENGNEHNDGHAEESTAHETAVVDFAHDNGEVVETRICRLRAMPVSASEIAALFKPQKHNPNDNKISTNVLMPTSTGEQPRMDLSNNQSGLNLPGTDSVCSSVTDSGIDSVDSSSYEYFFKIPPSTTDSEVFTTKMVSNVKDSSFPTNYGIPESLNTSSGEENPREVLHVVKNGISGENHDFREMQSHHETLLVNDSINGTLDLHAYRISTEEFNSMHTHSQSSQDLSEETFMDYDVCATTSNSPDEPAKSLLEQSSKRSSKIGGSTIDLGSSISLWQKEKRKLGISDEEFAKYLLSVYTGRFDSAAALEDINKSLRPRHCRCSLSDLSDCSDDGDGHDVESPVISAREEADIFQGEVEMQKTKFVKRSRWRGLGRGRVKALSELPESNVQLQRKVHKKGPIRSHSMNDDNKFKRCLRVKLSPIPLDTLDSLENRASGRNSSKETCETKTAGSAIAIGDTSRETETVESFEPSPVKSVENVTAELAPCGRRRSSRSIVKASYEKLDVKQLPCLVEEVDNDLGGGGDFEYDFVGEGVDETPFFDPQWQESDMELAENPEDPRLDGSSNMKYSKQLFQYRMIRSRLSQSVGDVRLSQSVLGVSDTAVRVGGSRRHWRMMRTPAHHIIPLKKSYVRDKMKRWSKSMDLCTRQSVFKYFKNMYGHINFLEFLPAESSDELVKDVMMFTNVQDSNEFSNKCMNVTDVANDVRTTILNNNKAVEKKPRSKKGKYRTSMIAPNKRCKYTRTMDIQHFHRVEDSRAVSVRITRQNRMQTPDPVKETGPAFSDGGVNTEICSDLTKDIKIEIVSDGSDDNFDGSFDEKVSEANASDSKEGPIFVGQQLKLEDTNKNVPFHGDSQYFRPCFDDPNCGHDGGVIKTGTREQWFGEERTESVLESETVNEAGCDMKLHPPESDHDKTTQMNYGKTTANEAVSHNYAKLRQLLTTGTVVKRKQSRFGDRDGAVAKGRGPVSRGKKRKLVMIASQKNKKPKNGFSGIMCRKTYVPSNGGCSTSTSARASEFYDYLTRHKANEKLLGIDSICVPIKRGRKPKVSNFGNFINRTCVVDGCTNNSRMLYSWHNEHRNAHLTYCKAMKNLCLCTIKEFKLDSDVFMAPSDRLVCSCKPPFFMVRFPKDRKIAMRWSSQLNRWPANYNKNFVCSVHFTGIAPLTSMSHISSFIIGLQNDEIMPQLMLRSADESMLDVTHSSVENTQSDGAQQHSSCAAVGNPDSSPVIEKGQPSTLDKKRDKLVNILRKQANETTVPKYHVLPSKTDVVILDGKGSARPKRLPDVPCPDKMEVINYWLSH